MMFEIGVEKFWFRKLICLNDYPLPCLILHQELLRRTNDITPVNHFIRGYS